MSDTNNVLIGIATPIISEILKAGIYGGGALVEKATKKMFSAKKFDAMAKKYASKLIEVYGYTRVLGATAPVPLKNIYTSTYAMLEIQRRKTANPKELMDKYSFENRSMSSDKQRFSGDDVVDKYSKLVILGKPGSGKTTYLKYLALRFAEGKAAKRRLPIIVTLREYVNTNKKLFEYIIQNIEIMGIDKAELFLKNLINMGNICVLLDGLDEVPQHRLPTIISEIREFIIKYSESQIIITCRSADYNYYFDNMTDAELADFNDMQISAYVDNWFSGDAEKAQKCIQEILDDPPVRELARIPLSLGMLCLLYEETLGFPTSRAELFEQSLDALLSKWDASKSIKREEIYAGLTRKRKEGLFSKIAIETFEEESFFFIKKRFENIIQSYLSNLTEEYLEPDYDEIIRAIEAQHGIVVEFRRSIYCFVHLSFHEYYASRYIIGDSSRRLLESIVKGHLHNERWYEVFRLVAEGLDDATLFFELLFDEIASMIIDEVLVGRFLTEIYEECDSLPDCVDHRWARAELIYAIIRAFSFGEHYEEFKYAIERASNNASDIADQLRIIIGKDDRRTLFRAIGNIIDYRFAITDSRLAIIKSPYSPTKPRRHIFKGEYHSDIIGYLDIFKLQTVYNDLCNGDGLQKLAEYLYCSRLILSCLSLECFIKKDVRAKIESNILLPIV